MYGSRAREDFKDRSDIDLAIDCPDAKESDWLKVLTIIEQADTLLKVDCVRLDTLAQDNPLRLSILKDGVYLYKKNLP